MCCTFRRFCCSVIVVTVLHDYARPKCRLELSVAPALAKAEHPLAA
jgi:hypothetical protein